MAVIVPTKKCDLRCTHCFRSSYESQGLDLDLLSRFLEEYKLFNPMSKHCLTGGEPTVFSKLEEMLEIFREHKCILHVVTNGQTTKGQDLLIKYRDIVKTITVSFDSPEETINDLTRGKGTFVKAFEDVKRYQSSKILAAPFYVLHDMNAHLVEEAF